MKLIVTGAAGWIGRNVCSDARSRGYQVVALDLPSSIDGPWDAYRSVNIAEESTLQVAADPVLAGADALIHCAGYAHRPIETPEEVARFYAINRDGSQRTQEIARRAGIRRVIYLSSIAFYDWTKGCDFAEDGPLARPTAYAASKLDGEQLFVESGLDWRVARLGTVFGEGDRANFAKLAAALAKRRFVVPGQGSARKSVLPVKLAAELLIELATMPEPPHRLLNLALPEAPTLDAICAAYVQACGFPQPKRLPLPLMRAMALAGDLAAKAKPNFPLTSLNMRKLTTSTTVNVQRMLDTFPERKWGIFAEWLQESSEYYRKQR
jgi:GlcNAc-P-P-Und epimerase